MDVAVDMNMHTHTYTNLGLVHPGSGRGGRILKHGRCKCYKFANNAEDWLEGPASS